SPRSLRPPGGPAQVAGQEAKSSKRRHKSTLMLTETSSLRKPCGSFVDDHGTAGAAELSANLYSREPAMRMSFTFALLFVGIVIACGATQASATSISIGSRIPITSTTFALPIEISGAVTVSGWQFDLIYNATDVQVNTGCDPFSGDIYCSLFTGPVTEGGFF